MELQEVITCHILFFPYVIYLKKIKFVLVRFKKKRAIENLGDFMTVLKTLFKVINF